MRRYNFLQFLLFFCLLCSFSSCGSKKEQFRTSHVEYPKREFRGAWIHTVSQGQYKNMNSNEMKRYFVDMLDDLQAAGINAVIFQVRPQADAFYKSNLEPWSRFLTGVQGKAPSNGFDPLQFLIEECHLRNMELHAWLNPYRVGAVNQDYAAGHIYKTYPERFLKYGTLIYFDPGIPENRAFICSVVKDIVSRYDVDAIHMDDYFYPYPIAGEKFPDDKSFTRYASEQGFSTNQRDDWRRNNVNMLIKEIKQTIVLEKPWVRFGVSPFGIYRNKKSTPDGSGSETNGLQNYDDLYADVKLWAKEGWIDYNLPQIYWEMGHKAADYTVLINWWAANTYKCPLYIGQDLKKSMDVKNSLGESQLGDKIELSRSFKTVQGNCFWPGYTILDNYANSAEKLTTTYHKYPALIPAYTHMHKGSPAKVRGLKEVYTENSHTLEWEKNMEIKNPEKAIYFVVYRFDSSQKIDLKDPQYIMGITREPFYNLPYEGGSNKYKYVVTAVDAFHNESKGQTKKVTL